MAQSFETIITQIENAHQDAITTFESLRDLLVATESFDITLSDGETYTVESYATLKKQLIDSLKTFNYSAGALTQSNVANYVDFVKFVDPDTGNDTTGTGTYLLPFATLEKAIRATVGGFALVFLMGAKKHKIARAFSSGVSYGDVMIENKVVIFDAYTYNAGILTLGNNIANIGTDTNKPVIYPQYTGGTVTSSTLACTIDKTIIDTFGKYNSSVTNLKIFADTESAVNNTLTAENTVPSAKPYYYSFVLRNSEVYFNNIAITNTFDGNDILTSGASASLNVNSFSSAFSAPTVFAIRPMPSIIKDFYSARTINETTNAVTSSSERLVCDNYFNASKNAVQFNGCSFYMYAHCGGLFYFNNFLDTSDKYKITINNSYQKMFISEEGNSTYNNGNYHRYSSIFYLENNRVLNDATVLFGDAVYASDYTNNVPLLEMVKSKYKLNVTIKNFLTYYKLRNGQFGSSVNSFYGTVSTTSPEFSAPLSFNLFRFVETYKQAVDADKSFVYVFFGYNYLDNKKAWGEYTALTPIEMKYEYVNSGTALNASFASTSVPVDGNIFTVDSNANNSPVVLV